MGSAKIEMLEKNIVWEIFVMKINEIIRERRLAKGFTQEQVANLPWHHCTGC